MAKRRKRGYHHHQKGYPRVSAGPLRNQYIHRIVAEAMLGRPLRKDEDVHHRDLDKRNFHPSNLIITGHDEHGWVSAKQHFYMKTKDERLRREWDEYFDEQTQTQRVEAIRNNVRELRGGDDGDTGL